MSNRDAVLRKEHPLPVDPQSADILREDMSDYVANLQLHMTLQARNLVPTLKDAVDSREALLQQTQATFEKYVSRQNCTSSNFNP
jgi:hypothetical protein